jgi:sugar lactone lactonase YvrE
LAWSPDGRWLFAVDSSARIVAVDPRTGRMNLVVPDTIVPALPVVQEVATRSAT